MSERTTIGGTAYESIGSSSSNLLLKCNGTARIQWGNKLIDLIKNGKIASDRQELLFIVSNEDEIQADGIYVLDNESNSLLWVCKSGEKYNLTGADLYISTNKEQLITVELKEQALKNIGIYYQTFEDLQNAQLQNGIVYVIDTQKLYIIKDSNIEDFSAKLTSITVELNTILDNVIKGALKIVLQIGDVSYLILSDNAITAYKSLCIKNECDIHSEYASDNLGYKLYIKDNVSYLDIDVVNVRNQLMLPSTSTQQFNYGMIVMFNYNGVIPDGWVVCDGDTVDNGEIEITTPNLTDLFIPKPLQEGDDLQGLYKYSVIYIMKT